MAEFESTKKALATKANSKSKQTGEPRKSDSQNALQLAQIDSNLLTPKDITQLQRTLGNTATIQLLSKNLETPKIHSNVVQCMPYDKLLDIKKSDEDKFIRTLFGSSCSVSVWKFPNIASGDGCMGKNTISSAHKVTVNNAEQQAALHINMMVTTKGFTPPKSSLEYSNLTIHLSKLHITARSAKNQLSIEANDPSILTAAKSIHCGPGNDWEWGKSNVTELLADLGGTVTLLDLQNALTPFGMAYMAGIRQSIKDEITRACRNREVNVTFEGDSTWA